MSPATTDLDGPTGEPVVVHRAEDATDRRRLRARVALLEALRHPGLEEPVGLSEAPGRLEVRTRWVGSRTLASTTFPDIRSRARFLAGVADTLADLHDRGIHHGDLSPEHVLVASDGRPVLCGLRPAEPESGLRRAADVQALGRLLVDARPGPEPAGRSPRPVRELLARRRLQALAASTTAPDPPEARELATRLAELAAPRRLATGAPLLGACGLLLVGLGAAVVSGQAPLRPSYQPTPHPVACAAPGPGRPVAGEATSPASRADVDGDGCDEPVSSSPGRITVGRVTYRLGTPADLTAVGDWDGDGRATPALVRAADGAVFLFPRWPTPGAPVGAARAATVPDVVHLRVAHRPGLPDLLLVDHTRGAPTVVAARAAAP